MRSDAADFQNSREIRGIDLGALRLDQERCRVRLGPKTSDVVDRRVVINPRQARELLTAVHLVGGEGEGSRGGPDVGVAGVDDAAAAGVEQAPVRGRAELGEVLAQERDQLWWDWYAPGRGGGAVFESAFFVNRGAMRSITAPYAVHHRSGSTL